MDCSTIPKGNITTMSVPPVYKAPYFSKGYLPFPPPIKPAKIPPALKKYMEEERRATLTPEQLAEELKPKVPTQWPDFKTAFKQFQCPDFIPREEAVKVEKVKLDKPPPGVSHVYWKLKEEKFGKPPSATWYRSKRFSIQEPKIPKKKATFPLYETPSMQLPSEYIFTPERQKRKQSYNAKLKLLKGYGNKLHNDLKTLISGFSKHDNLTEANSLIPENRLNYGCERVRTLCDMAPPVVYTIVKKFVTGPPHNNLFWLNRTEALECWDRIIGKDFIPKKCCVEAPIYQRVKPEIPALKPPPTKARRNSKQLERNDQCTAASKIKPVKSAPLIIPRDSNLPPFCDPIPPPELRLPWHIPPLKPKDGDDKTKRFTVDRTIDLDDIIPYRKDRYGHDRRKQRWIRNRIIREAMTEDFFKRAHLDSHMTELDMMYSVASMNLLDNTAQAKKDMMLAASLRRGDQENTAAVMRLKEAELQKAQRHALRNRLPDYSSVKSRYREPHKRYRRYSFI